MRQCLTSPEDGYYSRKNIEGNDPFGVSGDFVTAPEISQVFGELVGIWTLTEWLAQGRRQSGVHLIELGPGRGTLMADMLRVWSIHKAI
jgi:NADH dehydrogenase [ubiquinone] 1 alpha subcomplex assembly factor 7